MMDQLVTQRTDKRHSIRVFHSRQLGEESQTVEQTRVGAIDINRINVGAIGNVAPILNVLALPFLFRSADHLYKVIDGPIGEEILAALEPYGFIGLTFYDSGARSIYTARRPVRTIDDLRGQRIRIQQSDLMEKMIKALGGRADQPALRADRNRIDGQPGRWRGEQLAVLCLGRTLQVRAVLHRHRAHHGTGDRDHVTARLGRALARRARDLPRRRARVRRVICASNG